MPLGLNCEAETRSLSPTDVEVTLLGPGDVAVRDFSSPAAPFDCVLTLQAGERKNRHFDGVHVTAMLQSSITNHADVTLLSVDHEDPDRGHRLAPGPGRHTRMRFYVIMALNAISSATRNGGTNIQALLPKML